MDVNLLFGRDEEKGSIGEDVYSIRRQQWVLGGVCRYLFDICLHLHSPFIS